MIAMFGQLVDERMAWTPAELDTELREIELAHRALEARRAANLIASEARQVRDVDGHRSTQAYVRATTNQPGASVEVRRARFCREHPAAGEALRAGHIGVAQVDELARLAHHPRVGVLIDGDVLAPFLAEAEHSGFREFKSLIDQFVELLDQEGAWRDHLDDVARRTAFLRNVGGSVAAMAEGGDVLTADRLEKILSRFVEAEFERDVAARRAEHGDQADAHPLARTDAQRRFDAFVTIFDTANAHADAPGKPVDVCANVLVDQNTLHEAFAQAAIMLPNGNVFDPDDPEFGRRQREALIAEFAADPQAFLDRRCQTESGQPVHPGLLIQALLGGHIRKVIVDSNREVVAVGSKQRLFAGPWAVAARFARPTCEHPGCELPGHLCDVDHRQPHSQGGATEQANSAIECNPHNRLKHSRRWRTARARNRRLVTIREDGTLMLPAGERPPELSEPQRLQRIYLRYGEIITGRAA